MSKVFVFALAALCACAFAGSFVPKIPECSFNVLVDATTFVPVNITLTSSMMALYKGEEVYVHVNTSFMGMTRDSTTRCDVKKDGKCLTVDHSNGGCVEEWEEPDILDDDPIYYDSEGDVDCPDGGKCKKYCNSTKKVCYTVNSDGLVLKTEEEDQIIVVHYKSEAPSPDVFIVERCDGTKLDAPVDPCTPDPSSYSSGKPSSSHVDPSGNPSSSQVDPSGNPSSSQVDPSGNPSSSHVDSSASVSVPSALVVLLVAILVALF